MYGPYVPTPVVERTSSVGTFSRRAFSAGLSRTDRSRSPASSWAIAWSPRRRLTKMFLIFGAPWK